MISPFFHDLLINNKHICTTTTVETAAQGADGTPEETEIEALSAVVVQATEDSADRRNRCIRQPAQNAEELPKSHLSQMAASPCIAATALNGKKEVLSRHDSAEIETESRHLTAVLHRNHLSTDLLQAAETWINLRNSSVASTPSSKPF